MSTVAAGVLVVTCPSDSNQASKESAVCLNALTGDVVGLGVFNFIVENIFVDTVA